MAEIKKVAAIGDNCMDIYPRLNKMYPTGNVVDFAVNMRKLGVPTAVISTTGSDEYGKLMLDTLREEEIDISHLHVGDGPTAITWMDMDGTDRVHGDYHEGVLEHIVFTPQDIAFAARHDLVHTAFWGKADGCLDGLRSQGALISFDYATKKDSDLVARTLPLVDYAFFSFTGAQDEAPQYLRWASERGPRVCVATFGSQGSLAFDGKEFYSFGIYPATVVNTVGAGDAFIAGFMAAVLASGDLNQALMSGAKVAAAVVETFEPWVKSR